MGAKTVALLCNKEGIICENADISIKLLTGPEVITGSTRMKAGTAQKMVLNMLSTATMIKLGKVSGNMMTDMQISCSKLEERAKFFIMNSTGVNEQQATALLAKHKNNVKKAINEAII
jgi:N-acetylmuramic acid 6-phosphate etherase